MSVGLREATLTEAYRRLPTIAPLTLVETGTVRDAAPQARIGDGWSTYFLARLIDQLGPRNSRLLSIDINRNHIEVSKSIVPPELRSYVTWICSDSCAAIKALQLPAIDLLYLDSADDPELILREFQEATPALKPHSVVVIDDTNEYGIGPLGKGSLLIPQCESDGWGAAYRVGDGHRMTILQR